MTVRLVLFDIDGTLTRDRNTEALDPEALDAIQDSVARYKGLTFGVATGNTLIVAMALARYIGLPKGAPVIAENGCILYINGRVYALCEDLGLREVAYELLKNVPGLKPTYQFEYRRYDMAFITEGDPHVIYKAVMDELERRGLLDKVNVRHSGYALHIQPKGSGKAQAIRRLCELLGIGLDEVVYIGDSETDLDVIETVGLGVAVGNADDALKAKARIVLDKPSGKGVADFLRHVLPRLVKG